MLVIIIWLCFIFLLHASIWLLNQLDKAFSGDVLIIVQFVLFALDW